MPIPRALGEKGKKRHLWMRRKEREGHGGVSLERAKPSMSCPLPSNMAPGHKEEKYSGRFWKRKLVGWLEHI